MTYISLDSIRLKQVEREFKLSRQEIRTIEVIWKAECKQRELFNGTVLCFNMLEGNTLTTCCCPYKLLIASQKDKVLSKKLSLQPIGVTALAVCRNSLLIAKRSSAVSSYRGYLETVPSGSLTSTQSIENQLLDELYEETGLIAADIVKTKLVGLFYSPRSRIYDIGYQIEISKMKPLKGSKEHTLIEWKTFNSWKLLLASKKITPVSRMLWKQYVAGHESEGKERNRLLH